MWYRNQLGSPQWCEIFLKNLRTRQKTFNVNHNLFFFRTFAIHDILSHPQADIFCRFLPMRAAFISLFHQYLLYMKSIHIFVFAFSTLCPALLFAQPKPTTSQRMEAAGMVRVKDVDPSIFVSLGFARPDNIAKRPLYTDLQDAYLHPQAAQALRKAQSTLKRLRPDLSLAVIDAARPMSVQQQLHSLVKGKNTNIYINDPKFGGDQHNYGLAVDVTLCRENGDTLSMGTRIGDLIDVSQQGHEEAALARGLLTQEQIENRKLLRRVMAVGGFKPLRTQWWHFNFRTISEAKANFKQIP